MSACIDCGRPSVSGSPYCAGCMEPIYVSARDYAEAIRSELEED